MDIKEKRLHVIFLWIIIATISICQCYQMHLIHQEHYYLRHQILQLEEYQMEAVENNLLFRKEIVEILEDYSECLKSAIGKS